jgi:hypothetical protein
MTSSSSLVDAKRQHYQEMKMSDDTPNNAPPPVTIVLDTHSTDPDFNGDCDYAVVRLTPELVEQVRRRVELARQAGRQDDDLYELYFWWGTAEFYDSGLVDACEKALTAEQSVQDWLAGLERDGRALLPPAADLAACQPQRVECAQMIVRRSPSSPDPRHEIAWIAVPKHTDVYVTTRDLPLAAMEGYAGISPETKP